MRVTLTVYGVLQRNQSSRWDPTFAYHRKHLAAQRHTVQCIKGLGSVLWIGPDRHHFSQKTVVETPYHRYNSL